MKDPNLSERTMELLEKADQLSDEEYEKERQQLEKEWEEENRELRNADGYE